MDATNVIPQPSPAALFTFVAPVAAGKAGFPTVAAPAVDSTFAELFAKVAAAELSAASLKGATDVEPAVAAGTKGEKEGNEKEVSAPTADLSQVALAVPVIVPATVVAPPVQKDSPKVQVQESAAPVTLAMQLPVQEQPVSLASPVLEAAVEAPGGSRAPETGKQEAASPQQKAGGQEIREAVPQKSVVTEIKIGALATPTTEAMATVAAKTASAVPVETTVPEQVQPIEMATVTEPAASVSTVATTASPMAEPVEVAVPDPVEVVVRVTEKAAHMTGKAKGEAVQLDKALPTAAAASGEAVAADPTALTGTETGGASVAPVQGRSAAHHGNAEHAIPEVAANKPAVAGKEAGTASEKDLPVIKAAAEKAAFSPQTGDKEANSGNEEKSGPNVSHNPVMGEAVKTAAVESVHKADGGRSATAENVLVQVKETLALHNPKEAKQITMTLNPAELGELKINVSMDGQQLKVHVVAENTMVRDVLLANIDILKESLAKQNVTVERFNVSTGGNYTFNQPSGEEKWLSQRSSHQSYAAMGGMVADGEEQQVKYLNAAGTSLVDVRF